MFSLTSENLDRIKTLRHLPFGKGVEWEEVWVIMEEVWICICFVAILAMTDWMKFSRGRLEGPCSQRWQKGPP